MDGKEEASYDKTEGTSKFTEEYLQRASYLGTILPLLDIAYETLIEKTIKKHNLNIVKEFWIFFGLFIFTVIYFYFGIKLEVVIFFLFATIFTLVIYNLDFFKKRLLPDADDEIQNYISNINNKKFPEVIGFIKGYQNKLKEPEIQAIIESNQGNTWIIYKFILGYQTFSSNLLVFLIRTNKVSVMGEDLFRQYMEKFDRGMSYDNYRFLVDHFGENKQIMKIINKLNPSYLKTPSKFKKVAISLQSGYVSINCGKISGAIAFLSVTIAMIVAVTSFNQISVPYLTLEPYHTFPVLFLINYIFTIALLSGIIVLVIKGGLILTLKTLQAITNVFAPVSPDF
ncbi:MAG TPA: hypothetical protein PKM50_02565 [Methanoregula sp.]|nr:hypothetical protein [Methanoregula sp.]